MYMKMQANWKVSVENASLESTIMKMAAKASTVRIALVQIVVGNADS